MSITPRTALFVAHPGHELRLYHWLELVRPDVFVLTDGSGSAGRSRVPSTLQVLAGTGARAGSVMAPFTDHDIYDAILSGNVDPVAQVTLALADAFVARDVEVVVADAWEDYNPAHDLCRVMANLAIARASAELGRTIGNYEYPVVGKAEPHGSATELIVPLDDDAIARKLAAADAYPEMQSEVEQAKRDGSAQMRIEILRAVAPRAEPAPDARPFYETHGERQVGAGLYQTVLRYREHFAPFVRALTAAVGTPAVAAELTVAL